MNKKYVFVVLLFIFLVLLSCIGYSFFFSNNDNFLIINNDSIEFINNDVYVYNSDVVVKCKKCYLDNDRVKHVKISESGDYVLKYNKKKLNIKIDKKLNFEIVDYQGNVIHNYNSNKLPFKIKSGEDIVVNDESYNPKTGFYKVGNYELKIEGSSYKVSINNIERNNEYDIYLTLATLPSLYGALSFANSTNESFIWFGTSDTFDEDYLSSLDYVTLSNNNGNKDSIYNSLPKEIKNYIIGVLDKDDDAFFNLYLDEQISYLEYNVLSELGIDDNRYHVNYLTDGTMSYEIEYPYDKENSYKFYMEVSDSYYDILHKIRSNLISRNVVDEAYFIPSLARDNVTYYLQFPSFFTSKDKKMKSIYESVNYNSVSPQERYEKLNDKEKSIFRNVIGFDKSEFDKLYFNDNSKPYLIVTGLVPIDGNLGIKTFKNMIEYVVDEYGEKYNILYKPHPRALPDEDLISYFSSLNIGILPGKMPMEAITFVYTDLKLGGFTSSLYMSMEPDNVLFFFVENKKDIFEPIKSMLDSTYKNTELIKPSKFKV